MPEDDNGLRGNGWTQYQRLVLDTLKRHDKKLEDLTEQFNENMIAFTAVQVELGKNTESLKELVQKLDETKKAQIENRMDLSKLQWKLGTVITIASTVIGWIGQAVVKMFLHS